MDVSFLTRKFYSFGFWKKNLSIGKSACGSASMVLNRWACQYANFRCGITVKIGWLARVSKVYTRWLMSVCIGWSTVLFSEYRSAVDFTNTRNERTEFSGIAESDRTCERKQMGRKKIGLFHLIMNPVEVSCSNYNKLNGPGIKLTVKRVFKTTLIIKKVIRFTDIL